MTMRGAPPEAGPKCATRIAPRLVHARVRRVDDARRARAEGGEAFAFDADAVEHRERPFVNRGRLSATSGCGRRVSLKRRRSVSSLASRKSTCTSRCPPASSSERTLPTSPRNARTRTSIPSATRVIPPRSHSATAWGARPSASCRCRRSPRSSSAWSACDLPAPDSPLTTTTVGRRGSGVGLRRGVRVIRLPPFAGARPGSTRSSRSRSRCGASVDRRRGRGLRIVSGAGSSGSRRDSGSVSVGDAGAPSIRSRNSCAVCLPGATQELVARGHLEDLPMSRPGRTGTRSSRMGVSENDVEVIARRRGGRTPRRSVHSQSRTTSRCRFRSRTAVTPNSSRMSSTPSPRISMCGARARRARRRRSPAAAIAMDDVVGDETMPAHDELEGALALADAALAEQQDADPEHVHQHPVELRLRSEAVVEDGVEGVDRAARAALVEEERRAGRLGRRDESARRFLPARDHDARKAERKEPARGDAPRVLGQRIEVRELRLAEHLNARRHDAVECPASARPFFWTARMAERTVEAASPAISRGPTPVADPSSCRTVSFGPVSVRAGRRGCRPTSSPPFPPRGSRCSRLGRTCRFTGGRPPRRR